MPNRRRLSFENRILLLALLTGLPGALATAALLFAGGYSAKVQWTADLAVLSLWLGFAFAVQGGIVRPLRILSNLLAALREEDFSFRARETQGEDALALAMSEVNALADTLREQRLGALEATALLRTVMSEIEVAVFTLDGHERLQLVNRAGARLLGRPPEQLLGRSAGDLGLAPALAAAPRQVLDLAVAGTAGRFEVSGGTFRQHGLPQRLLVLTDVSRALREEERLAWQRLIRVLGHELNNSLAPIRSLADSLGQLVARQPRPDDWEADMRRGLAVIAARSESLSRFLEAYGRLARLPAPQRQRVDLGTLLRRVAGLEQRVPVAVREGPPVEVQADPVQLEQVVINLLRNAAEASLDAADGKIELGWEPVGGSVDVWIDDRGPGLPDTANLFVPFFTTKPQGSGIGLVLSRQIAEAHGGTLVLENRRPGPGCRARLRLPREG
ncbi:MAG: PAS domain-containing sensor histidine kinase [Acidobacteria bacterium]|nr:MAG: PAS domain-containing sensor histidine kinase [Acidobacteriota bacterium]